ncbi:hypothetical protein MA16_Dca008466 [Dendrobium catenatum]|uniref:Uncharacterized protein n=1 Tax=Dendrobium catenatum TaxID=906689 RepID=A0A2I0XHJ4_9ASPA|nr:hypothetical protein MA16_Dca008466 [Dendrobium catenatum]
MQKSYKIYAILQLQGVGRRALKRTTGGSFQEDDRRQLSRGRPAAAFKRTNDGVQLSSVQLPTPAAAFRLQTKENKN